jgi:hypothetical protein
MDWYIVDTETGDYVWAGSTADPAAANREATRLNRGADDRHPQPWRGEPRYRMTTTPPPATV